MKGAGRLVLALALLASVAADGRCAGERDAVVEGLSGKAHFHIQRAHDRLDAAIGDPGAGFPQIRAEFDRALGTSLAVARDLNTAFALAVTSGRVEDDAVGLFNAAVDATLTLTSRLDEVLATCADPPEDLDHYRRELASARSLLEDRKGRIKKLGGAGRAPR